MQHSLESRKIVELTLLWEIAKLLNGNFTPHDLINSLNNIFQSFFKVNYIKIWIYEENSETLRDFSRSWHVIDSKDKDNNILKLYKTLNSSRGQGFLLNNRLIFLNSIKENVLENINQDSENIHLTIPIIDKNKIIGIIEISSNEYVKNLSSLDYLMTLNIAATQIATAIVNMKLRDQMELNLNFHKAMKDIAKIIETQYELNYVIPLVGEMIDKFIGDHLTYFFCKDDNDEFKLLWPGSYNSERLDKLLKKVKKSTDYIISDDKHIGLFPIKTNGNLNGVIVTDSLQTKLLDKDISYLEQLSRQAAITIEKANNYAETLKQATIDALTGLNNRRQFNDRLAEEVSNAKRKNISLCCMMIDMDYFKNINDTYGHIVGDQILHDLARIIRNEIRTYDIAARYGGDEFCVLLPDTQLSKSKIIAERLRKKIEETQFDVSSFKLTGIETISITISIGISKYNSEYKDYIEFLQDADKALYRAKQEGRNRVILNRKTTND